MINKVCIISCEITSFCRIVTQKFKFSNDAKIHCLKSMNCRSFCSMNIQSVFSLTCQEDRQSVLHDYAKLQNRRCVLHDYPKLQNKDVFFMTIQSSRTEDVFFMTIQSSRTEDVFFMTIQSSRSEDVPNLK